MQNLSLRDYEKGLSTGEKQMFVKAKKILASELMYALDLTEEEAAAWLESVSGPERQEVVGWRLARSESRPRPPFRLVSRAVRPAREPVVERS